MGTSMIMGVQAYLEDGVGSISEHPLTLCTTWVRVVATRGVRGD